MSITIEPAQCPEQFEAGRQMFSAYAAFLGLDLEFQDFSSELASLATMYGSPRGALLLASLKGSPVGAVGLREFEPGVAEMKRMYVLPHHQGTGVGKALVEALLARADAMGYGLVRLDTIPELDRAIRLYRKFGFREIGPYRYNPHPNAVFMECALPIGQPDRYKEGASVSLKTRFERPFSQATVDV